MAASGAEVVIVCAFGALIKEPLLADFEILNVHPSLLPRWRGAAPVERAIMAGDEQTGVAIMRLTAGLDSGPVCLMQAEPIEPDDDYGTLAARLEDVGATLLVRALDERPPFVEQSEEGVTYAEKITAADRTLDPAAPAEVNVRIVRALHPHIGARLPLERRHLPRRSSRAGRRGRLARAARGPAAGRAPDGLRRLPARAARRAEAARGRRATRRAAPPVGRWRGRSAGRRRRRAR